MVAARTWETSMAFWDPDFSLAQPWLAWAFGWKIFLSFTAF